MGDPNETGSWYARFRKREDSRAFKLAFLASALFHLSMVTVFSIVIYFPRNDTEFYDFKIVPLSAPAINVATTTDAPATDVTAGGDKLALRGGAGRSLPALELPTLEFDELKRLRVRQAGLESFSRYDDIFQEQPADSWERFSRGLSDMSRTLSQLRLSGGDDPALENASETDPLSQIRIVHRPAEGFEAQVAWSAPPKDRQLLFSPPIEALWGVEAGTLQRPIEVVLEVNPLGRVVNVFSPNVDDRDLVDAVQMTVLQYRFEPLDLENGQNQTATLQIRRERETGTP